VRRDKTLYRVTHFLAAVCYALAWLAMVAMIAMVVVAELIQGEAAAGEHPWRPDALDHLCLARRTPSLTQSSPPNA
jgi:hypothetical protein